MYMSKSNSCNLLAGNSKLWDKTPIELATHRIPPLINYRSHG